MIALRGGCAWAVPSWVVVASILCLPSAGRAVLRELEVHRSLNIVGAKAVVVSPDGANVYLIATAGDSLATYDVDPDGTLTFVGMLRDGVGGVHYLDGPLDMIISGDGMHVYVTSPSERAVSIWARDPGTGALGFVGAVDVSPGGPGQLAISPGGEHVYVVRFQDVLVFARDGGSGMLTLVQTVPAGVSLRAVAVSPDGSNVYAGGWGSSFGAADLFTYARDPVTGLLTLTGSLVQNVVNDLAVSSDGSSVYAASEGGAVRSFGRAPGSGLLTLLDVDVVADGVDALALDATGSHLYAANEGGDSLSAFSRAGTGELTAIDTEVDGSGGVDGLAGAQGVALAPTGDTVYVAGGRDAAVAVFDRDPGSGLLGFLEANVDALIGTPDLLSPDRPLIPADGHHLYVRTASGLVVFQRDPASGSLTFGSVVLPGATAFSTTFSPDGAHVYVSVSGNLDVYARDVVSGALAPVESHGGLDSCSVTVSPDGAHVYVRSCGTLGALYDAEILERDPMSGSLTDTGTSTQGVGAFSPDGRHSYVRGVDEVLVFTRDALTGMLSQTSQAHADPSVSYLVVTADGRHVYGVSGSVVALFQRDPGSGFIKQVQAMDLGCPPAAFCSFQPTIDPLGGYLFADASQADRIVSLARDPLGGKPRPLEEVADDEGGFDAIDFPQIAVAPDGRTLYASALLDDAITVMTIDPCGSGVKPKVVFTKIASDPVPGDDRLKVKADVLLRDATFADLDPVTTGARLVVTTASGIVRLDATLPGGVFAGAGTAGWVVNGAGTVWTFNDRSGSAAGGITKIKIQDRGGVYPNLIRARLTGKNGSYPVVPGDEPLTAALEFGSTTLCATVPFAAGECNPNGAGTALACKAK